MSYRTEWPSWAALLFIACLPFGRWSEVPLSLFAISLPLLWRMPRHRDVIRKAAAWLIPLFGCFWLPMVISSFDSVSPLASWVHSLAALRFLAAALSMVTLLHPASVRWRMMRWTSWLLLFWAVDGFVQLLFGSDLLGIEMHPDRLNALFMDRYQFYGPTLAMLSPLALEYARREWPPWAWALLLTAILGAVMISGMRSGWLSMAVVLTAYLVLMTRRENRRLRRAMPLVPVLAMGVMALSYFYSPLFQERLELTGAAYENTGAAINHASSDRLPIFATALRMFRHHPINGVGVRAFPEAYMVYAEPGDIHIEKSGGKSGATHAHNVVLEVMSDTGSIGLAGLLLAVFIAVRHWRRAIPAQRRDAFPFMLSVFLIMFPLNSHFALYGTYVSSLLWFLLGLWGSTVREGVTAA